MKIILKKEFYGYCPGLKRSFDVANELISIAKKDKKLIYCDVPLAHNADVMAKLRRQGVRLIEIERDTKANNSYFLISAHGASAKKIKWLKSLGYKVWDATCPKVMAVQKQVSDDYKAGYQIVIFGKADHAEVEAVNGMADKSAIIFNNIEEAKEIDLNKKTSVISQTTYPVEKFEVAVRFLKERNPDIEIVARKTTCSIVKSRIDRIVNYISDNSVEMAVVVGSPTSSNTKSLAGKLKEKCRTIMVADERSLRKGEFKHIKSVLIVSGTSAPPEVVEKVAEKIESFDMQT